MVPDFRVSQRTEWNPIGILRGEIKTREELRKGTEKDRKELTWLIFELKLQMKVTKFKY